MPDYSFLDQVILGNSVLRWLLALLTVILVLAAAAISRRIFSRRLQFGPPATSAILEDLGQAVSRTTAQPIVFLLALYAGSLSLTFDPQAKALLRAGAIILVLIQLGIWGNTLIARWMDRYVARQPDPGAAGTARLFGFLARLALYVLLFLLILDNIPGVEITALLASVGIGGIAVALAVQNILGDLFASLSIALDKPFVVGDFISVGSEMGTVEEIGLKTTRVRSISGEQLIFSNTDLLNSRIRNFGRMQERRVVFSLGVSYETSVDTLRAIPGIIRSVIEAQERVRFDRAHLARIDAYDLVYEVVYFVLSPDFLVHMDIQQEISLKIIERFRAEAIDIIYPTQQIYLYDQTPARNDRSGQGTARRETAGSDRNA
ncbi:MAG: mechanosensitive ion channel family protein [Chloroflexaceae bacterium]